MSEECEMLRGIKYDDNHMSEQLTLKTSSLFTALTCHNFWHWLKEAFTKFNESCAAHKIEDMW